MDNNKKKKVIIISVVVSILLILLIGGTIAYFGWSGDESLVDVTVSSGSGTCTKLSDNNALLEPTSTKEKGRILKITAKQEMADKAYITWDLVVNAINGLQDKTFVYELVNNTTGTVYTSNGTGNFENVEAGDTITFSSDELLDYNKDYEFTLYLWIDGTIGNNPLTMADQIFDFDISCNITGTKQPTVTVAQYITNLYTSAKKETVTNNNITYNYATSVSLMNDRLGGTTSDLDAGNIRYYGANPNNYIDFGDTVDKWATVGSELGEFYLGRKFTSESDCRLSVEALADCSSNYNNLGFNSEKECIDGLPKLLNNLFEVSTIKEVQDKYCSSNVPFLYRIIGIFKNVELDDGTKQDLVKIVSNESIGSFSWDASGSSINDGYGINDWSQADLMKLLNPGYESETIGGSLWWNSGSGTCYSGSNNATTSCDFAGTGLSSNVQNKIASVVWNLGGWSSTPVYSDQMYGYERGTKVYSGRPTSWSGKIALAYPSDYGYAADFSSCSVILGNYSDATCTSVNWMKTMIGSEHMWLLTPISSNADNMWCVYSSGGTGNYGTSYAIRAWPVLYLNSEAIIGSGNGSSSNPYRLNVS